MKKFCLVLILVISATILMGANYAESTTNPLIGKYMWHNIHFNTNHEVEITEDSFYGNGYKITGISGRSVEMTVFEFHGKYPAKFIVTVDNDDSSLYYFARKDTHGEYTVIATARRE